MDQPEENSPDQVIDTDSIHNLDTARMALRWALERLQKLDKDKGELAQRLESAQRTAQKAQEEHAAVMKTLTLRSSETDQRELYYAKLEEFLSMRLQGQLDLPALAKRELEAAQLQELLSQKQAQLGREFEIKRSALETDYSLLKKETERQSRELEKRLENQAESKRKALEQDYLSKLGQIHEKQAVIKQEEATLAERQAHFEDYYNSHRAQLHIELKNLRAEIDDQVAFRTQASERMLAERQAALEDAWQSEKNLILKELDGWKRRCQELSPRALKLEEALSLEQERAQKAESAADRCEIVLSERQAGWDAEKANLAREIAHWQSKCNEAAEQVRRMDETLAAAQAQVKVAQAETVRQTATTQAERAAWQCERAELAEERETFKRKHEEMRSRVVDWENRATEAEDAAHTANNLLESERRKSLERETTFEKERELLLREATSVHDRGRDALPQLLKLEREVATAREAHTEALRRYARIEQASQAWDMARADLESDVSALRQKLNDALGHGLDLERRLVIAEEGRQQVQAAGERQAARFDEQRQAWEKERVELNGQLSDLRLRAAERAARLVEVEKKLAAERAAIEVLPPKPSEPA